MRLNYLWIAAAFIAIMIFLPSQKAIAQGDTLLVEWADDGGLVNTDILRNTIAADTNRPAGRVYKLQKGGFYWITEEIVNNGFPLRIVGEQPDPNDQFGSPAVIQMVARDDATVNGRMITGGGDITLKNLYIIGSDNNGAQTYYQPIQDDASDTRFVADNCIFERTNFALTAFTAKNNTIIFTNCKFRNLIGRPSTQQWEGRGISVWADNDTVIVENCTFFNVGMTALQIEGGSAAYVRFNHNTIVNLGRAINTGNWFQEAYFANNLIINGFWHGENPADYNADGRDPRSYTSGLFSIGALPSKYGPEEGRRILFANSAAWLDPAFVTYYGDSVRSQPFVGPVTAEDFFDQYENIVTLDTMWLSTRPNIGTYPDTLVDDMIQNINDLHTGVTPAHPYFYQLAVDQINGGECYVCPSWPLPENFAYTDASLLTAGTDGLPLGDLNWFPTQKADFESNKDAYIEQLVNLAGPITVFEVDSIAEAENGTLGGDASIGLTSGFAFYRFETAGTILWTFDLPAAVPDCKLVVYTNLTGQNPRGENLLINGVNLINNTGFGEYHWTSPPLILDGWDSLSVTSDSMQHTDANTLAAMQAAFDLPAGANTIELRKSWGYQNFSGVSIYDASDNLIKKLTIQEASYDGGILTVEGAVWTASGLQFVKLGANGNVSWNLNASEAGDYILRIFYQNYSGAQTGQISLDGSVVVPSVNFDSNTDSTGLDLLTDEFSLTAGAHTITLSGSSANIDYVQLIQKKVISDVNESNILQSYKLEQNYPNPFNPTTNINFSIGKASNVKLTVYNILGQKVAILVNGFLNAGTHSVQFNAVNFASGVYFYSLEADNFNMNKKMILLK